MIHLHTLGDTLITVGEKEIRPTAPVLFAVLLYLGMERGRRVPRAALQEMLFPRAGERSGAHSLRQLLYKLRQLGAPIEGDAVGVLVSADDVHDEASVEHDFTNGHFDLAPKYALGLLPEYVPSLSERYDEWLDQQRTTVAARVRRQLIAAMIASRERIDWPAAERFGNLILQSDPFNEEATLTLAEVTFASGSKQQAITMLSRYERETGRSDLRVAPALLRRRISEQSTFNDWRRHVIPFVGREKEIEIIRTETRRAREGSARLLVIAGEAGIGKSRLLQETSALSTLDGVQVQVARCQPHHASRPLGVFLELVPSLMKCPGALGVSPHSLEHLKLLTSHRDERDDRPVDARDDATRSEVVSAALRDLIDAITSETPLLLAIEDVQWADERSLRELRSYVQDGQRRPLMVIFTSRTADPTRSYWPDDAPLLRLKPLAESSMELLARQLVPESIGQGHEVASWCARTAAGNPMFLMTLCDYYVSTGKPYVVPVDLIGTTTSRVETLSGDSRHVLELVALLGKHASPTAITRLADITSPNLLSAVRSLEDGGYLALDGSEIRVSHDLVKDAVLNLIPPIASGLLHARVARYLEELYLANADAGLLWDCADHWAASSESEKAVDFIARCARHATDIGQAAQAILLLQRARTLTSSAASTNMVIGEQMRACKAAGRWGTVFELSKELQRTDEHSDVELMSIEVGWLMTFEVGDARQRLLDCATSKASSLTHRLDAIILLLRISHECGDDKLAREAFEAIVPSLDTNDSSYSMRIVPLIYHTCFGDRTLALDLARRFRRDLHQYALPWRFRAALNIATAFCFLGADEEFFDLVEEYHSRAQVLGMKEWCCDFSSTACWRHLQLERLEKAQEWFLISESERGARAGGAIHRRLMACACEIALLQREAPRARQLLAALKDYAGSESVRVASYLCTFETRLKMLDADFTCSEDEIAELIRNYEATKSLTGVDFEVATLAQALLRAGRPEQANELVRNYLQVFRRERSAASPSLVEAVRRIHENCAN